MPDPYRARGEKRYSVQTDMSDVVSRVMTQGTEHIVAWVAGDKVRAERVLSVELARPKARRALVEAMEAITDGART